jgi:membrane dipeptidase
MPATHKQATLALTHDHTMYGLAARRSRGETAVFSRHYAPRFRQGGVDVVGWVVGGDPPFFGIENDSPWWGSLELLDMMWREAEESDDTLAICLDHRDIDAAMAAGRIAVVLTMEGAFPLEEGSDPLINLRTLHRLGVRSLQLVGQGWNRLTDARGDHPHPSEGLTSLGVDVIREMNRLGMVIDVAHVPDPDPAFEDVIAASQDPVIDSHRGVRGGAYLPRNIGDERIRTIAETGGVIGLQFFSAVLTDDPNRRATVEDLIRHVDHIVEVAGAEYVALGPDFLEPTLIDRRPDHYASGLEDVTQMTRVVEVLVGHGYSDGDIRKILGENILRV